MKAVNRGNGDAPKSPLFCERLPPPANKPRFVAEINASAAPIATGGDLRLFLGSPALDQGLNGANPSETDLGGSARIANGSIDLGAYEGFVDDPALLWETDFDLDGRTYGLEVATATDPETADRDPQAGFGVRSDGLPVLQFSCNTGASPSFLLKVMRSPDLSAGSFVEIFRISNTGFGSDTEEGNSINIPSGGGLIIFGDTDPPAEAAFYRLEAEFTEP
jgi:hypothetical protein